MPRATRSEITTIEFRRLYHYDYLNGRLIRKRDNKPVKGLNLRVLNEHHETSRFIWLHFHGIWPPLDKLVDHKDRNRRNWKITNLRLATYKQNAYNAISRNPDFPKGVAFSAGRTKPWAAYIRIDGRKTNLGRFAEIEEAASAYVNAAIKYHGEFACLE